MADDFQVPPGHVICTTYGSVTGEMLESWGNTRAFCIENGLKAVAWPIIHGVLVDKARNDAVTQFMRDTAKLGPLPREKAPWLLFIDGDMQWQPNAILGLLETAYRSSPWADIVGAWCPLRGEPYLPTIDPGSGHWEPIAPGSGPVEVMRTGAAFVLIKRYVFEKMAPPWYGVRPVPGIADVVQEFETYCLTKFDGDNPFRAMPEWAKLEKCVSEDSQPADPIFPFSYVGEDSNFSDKARALGFRICVQTNVTINHVERHTITPEMHLKSMRELRAAELAACGIA